jgi:hypothetical protein
MGGPFDDDDEGEVGGTVVDFDPANRRAGLPEDVAALVDAMDDSSASVTLVNLHPAQDRTVIVQGGAYGEHQITSVKTASGEEIPVDGRHFAVQLKAGSGERLTLSMKRYVNQPSFAFPWV